MTTSTSSKPHLFILGASGYVGSVLTPLAISSGYTVTGLTRSPTNSTKLLSLGATPILGSLSTPSVLTTESSKADMVIDLSAFLPTMNRNERNEAVDAILEGLKSSGKGGMLIITSGSLVVAPNAEGGETKEEDPHWEESLNGRAEAERYAFVKGKEVGVNVVAVRLAPWVFGRGGSGVALFMRMGAKVKVVKYVGDGEKKTSTVHVDDAARLYLLVAEKGRDGEAYNATGETNVSFREIAEAMGEVLGVPVRGQKVEEAVEEKGMFLATFLAKENRASSEKARRELEWETTQTREKGILEEIRRGSYVELAKELQNSALSH